MLPIHYNDCMYGLSAKWLYDLCLTLSIVRLLSVSVDF